MYIGAHVSAAGGLCNAIANARAIRADAFQIFGSSPRQWHVRDILNDEVEMFRATVKQAGMGPIVFHAPYLVNLGSPDSTLRKKSEDVLSKNYQNAQRLDISGVIFHIGSRRDLPWTEAKKYVAQSLQRIFSHVPGKSYLAIENSAGGGNTIGSTLEEIAEIIREVRDKRLKFCYDTAHGLASGIISGYTPETVSDLFFRINRVVGKGRLAAVHLNDSKTPYCSNSDRHENIGEGHIGMEGIRAFVQNKDFQKVPWYLEVPGFDGLGPDKKNIERVRKMIFS